MEEINQDLPVDERESEEQYPRPRRWPIFGMLFGFIKNLIIFVILIAVIVGSFWMSFELGRKILFPAKNVRNKIKVAVPEPPPSIMALQELEKIMSDEVEADPDEKVEVPKAPKVEKPKAVEKKIAPIVVPPDKKQEKKPEKEILIPVISHPKPAEVIKEPVKKEKKIIQKKHVSRGGFYKVQAGLFADKETAIDLSGKVNEAGFETYLKNTSTGWRVQVGAYKRKSEAEALKNALEEKGLKAVILFE